MRLRSSRLAVGLVAAALVATACNGDADDEGTDGPTDGSTGAAEVLVVGTVEKPSTIDPAKVYEKMASDFLFNTTDRLVELEPGTGDAVPGVASEWDISDDGLTYTFTLREGVTFQDGTDLTSEDVKWSLERSLGINHPSGACFLIAGVTSVDAPDPGTVVITLDTPNVTFLSRLAYTVATILPSDSDVYTSPDEPMGTCADSSTAPALEDADAFIVGDAIVGSGPYEMTSYDADQGATFEAWDGYWGDAPLIPTVRVEFFETTAQMATALENGEIDMNINDFGPAERSALEAADGVSVELGEGGRIRYIVFDVTQAPFDDPAVLRTISATIDRQRVIDEVFEGVGTPIYSMVPPGYPASVPASQDFEAEVEGPIAFDLWAPLNKYGDTEEDMANEVARSLNESGIFEVTVKTSDWAAEYADTMNTGAYGAFTLGWYPDYIDPDDYIEPFYHSGRTFLGFYDSAEMNALIEAEQAETDTGARDAIFADIQELAAQDSPIVPLYEETFVGYFLDDLMGVESSMDIAGQARWYLISR